MWGFGEIIWRRVAMDTISLLHAKLHRVRITECRPDYVGSLGIDRRWLKKIGLLPLEEIQCWNVTRGSRFTTYAIAAPAGSKEISPNGACAHLCQEGDLLIIAAFQRRAISDVRARGHRARVLVFNAQGDAEEYLEQDLTVRGDDFEFVSTPGSLSGVERIAAEAAA
jgi:aspartate 1-decarboxylase